MSFKISFARFVKETRLQREKPCIARNISLRWASSSGNTAFHIIGIEIDFCQYILLYSAGKKTDSEGFTVASHFKQCLQIFFNIVMIIYKILIQLLAS